MKNCGTRPTPSPKRLWRLGTRAINILGGSEFRLRQRPAGPLDALARGSLALTRQGADMGALSGTEVRAR